MCIKSVMLFATSAICRERMYRLTYPCSTSLTACNTQSHSANTSLFRNHSSHEAVSDARVQESSCCGLQTHACRPGPQQKKDSFVYMLDADELLKKAARYCEADCRKHHKCHAGSSRHTADATWSARSTSASKPCPRLAMAFTAKCMTS